MSREFSNHHPIIFKLTIKNGQEETDLTLVSHNIQHFNWAGDNPFNKDPGTRKRGMVLQNYLQQFDVVALQEVSQTILDPPPPEGDDELTDESEDEEQVAKIVAKSVKKAPDVPGTLFGVSISEMKRVDPGGPLSQAGNLVKISGGGNQKHCDTVPTYDGSWDIKICLLEKDGILFMVGSVHDSVDQNGLTKGLSDTLPVDWTVESMCADVMDDSCQDAPLLFVGDWNTLGMDNIVNSNTDPNKLTRSKLIAKMAAGFGPRISCDSVNSRVYLPGFDDTIQPNPPNNMCGTGGAYEFVTTSVAYYDFLYFCERGKAATVDVTRAKIDQWLVGFDTYDDCFTDYHDYAGPLSDSGCSEGTRPPGVLDTYSDHRPVYLA
ncbi:hypothetical protein HDU87_001244 [Geranomyces variabilis]|uniref:Endonuclease/exonuclease/phosphatase domain-containing protein n=1 Tax=Geranomyces variabilis TaxID=109894 RepID=A0AAD5TGX3_9FUNG|nr:hypothetical protein HDU87_001244 [Geranomyces variabilis]